MNFTYVAARPKDRCNTNIINLQQNNNNK